MEDIWEEFITMDPLQYGPLVLLALLLTAQLYYYLRYYAAPLRYNRKVRKGKIHFSEAQPGLSIIISAQNESEHLEEYIPQLMEQDYPQFEVIVVNNGSSDETTFALDRLAQKYNRLKISFLPANAKFMSRKKMCLSIGIKAASYETVIFTDADCLPVSKNWLSEIAKCYDKETEMVLGYSRYKNTTSHLVDFDTLFSTLQYMGFALCGHAFRGTIKNMSYYKNTYDKIKGFTTHLNKVGGEDDIFVSQATDKHNTRVLLSPDSAMLCDRDFSGKAWRRMKEMQIENRNNYKTGVKFSLKLDLLTRVLLVLSIIGATAYYATQMLWLAMGLSLFAFILKYLTQSIILYKGAKLLGTRQHIVGVLYYELRLPFYEFYLRTFGRIGNKKWDMWRE